MISQEIEILKNHPLIAHSDWLIFIARPPGTMHIEYGDASSGSYPKVEFTLDDSVSQETLATFGRIQNIEFYSKNIVDTFYDIELNLSLLKAIKIEINHDRFDKNDFKILRASKLTFEEKAEKLDKLAAKRRSIESRNFRLIKFYTRYHFLLIPTVLEQLYQIIDTLLQIEYDFKQPIRNFEKIVSKNEPLLWNLILEYKNELKDTKQIRNSIAHLREFEDKTFHSINNLLEVDIQYNSQYGSAKTNSTLLSALLRFRNEFIETASPQVENLLIATTNIFSYMDEKLLQEFPNLKTA